MHEICLKLFIHRYNTEIIAACWLDTTSKITTTTLSFLRKTKDRNSSTSSTGIFLHSTEGVGGHSPVLLTRRSMFGARPKTPVQFRAYWIFLLFFRCAFFALKYAIGTTGFTVILRDTGRICTIFNEIFALTFATAVYFKSR